MALLVEDPVEIPNNAVDIPDDVVDNDNNAEDNKENTPNNAEEPQETPIERVAAEELHTPVAKRKPGRPPGSKNLLQGKPRKPRVKKVEVIEEPIEEESSRAASHEALFEDPVEEEPQYQRIPTVATTSKEERMLRLLSDHAKSRRSRKVALWKSWF